MEVTVLLDFRCCSCEDGVSVTLQCAGRGLLACGASAPLATVKVPCPRCGQINQVFFETNGAVRLVQPCFNRPAPTPSVN